MTKIARAALGLLLAVLLLPAPRAQAVGAGHSGWTWGSPLPQGETINAIDFKGTRGYAAGQFGTVMRSDDAGLTWTGLVTGTTEDLDHVAIIDSDSVVIAGNCTVRRSDDGGRASGGCPGPRAMRAAAPRSRHSLSRPMHAAIWPSKTARCSRHWTAATRGRERRS